MENDNKLSEMTPRGDFSTKDADFDATAAKLKYTLSYDEAYYIVSGVNVPTLEGKLVIPSEHEGKPVREIGASAFSRCNRLASVVIPSGMTKIGSSAFFNCKSLTDVILSDSVTDIGEHAFYYCTSLKFNEHGNCKHLGTADNPYFALVDIKKDKCNFYNIHTDTKIIAGTAFAGSNILNSIIIPEGVTTIGDSAFAHCSNASTLVIPGRATLPSLHPQNNYCTL